MRSIKFNTWAFGLIVILILAGYQVEAQRDRGEGFRKGNRSDYPRGVGDGSGPMSRMESALDLNDEQKTEIEKIHVDMQKELLPTFNELREKNVKLSTLISENESESKISLLIDEISKLQATVRKGHVSTHFKVRELLTNEQKIKFDTFSGNRFNDKGHHSGSMGRHGRGRI
jgi:Spy/CpxP family protein refolding chaperone